MHLSLPLITEKFQLKSSQIQTSFAKKFIMRMSKLKFNEI